MTNWQKFIAIYLQQDLVRELFEELYESIKIKSVNKKIEINNVEVTSSFGTDNQVEIRCGIELSLTDIQTKVPEDLYEKMANIVGVEKKNKDLFITLGYGMRCLEEAGTCCHIVSGSHCSLENFILLDIPTYIVLGSEAMQHRFGHEMLHEFGFDETEVILKEDQFFFDTKELTHDIINDLYIQLSVAREDLNNRVNRIFMPDSREERLLNRAYIMLLRSGGINLEGATITIEHPIKKTQQAIPIL